MKRKILLVSILCLGLSLSAQNNDNKPVQSNLVGSSINKFKYKSKEQDAKPASSSSSSSSSKSSSTSSSSSQSKKTTSAAKSSTKSNVSSTPKVTPSPAPVENTYHAPAVSSSLYAKQYNSPYTNYNLSTTSPQLIDLGLPSGTQWANMNVGASHPYLPGEFYIFIESADLDKNVDIPSKDQWQELIDKCTWTWESVDGGRQEVFRVTGPNGNYIYLPLTGIYQFNQDSFLNGEYGEYWSSSDASAGGLDEGFTLSLKKRSDGSKPGQIVKQTKSNGLAIRLIYNAGNTIQEPYTSPEGYRGTKTTVYRDGITTVTETYTDNEGYEVKTITETDKDGRSKKKRTKSKTINS